MGSPHDTDHVPAHHIAQAEEYESHKQLNPATTLSDLLELSHKWAGLSFRIELGDVRLTFEPMETTDPRPVNFSEISRLVETLNNQLATFETVSRDRVRALVAAAFLLGTLTVPVCTLVFEWFKR
jgi:hypothetical protein